MADSPPVFLRAQKLPHVGILPLRRLLRPSFFQSIKDKSDQFRKRLTSLEVDRRGGNSTNNNRRGAPIRLTRWRRRYNFIGRGDRRMYFQCAVQRNRCAIKRSSCRILGGPCNGGRLAPLNLGGHRAGACGNFKHLRFGTGRCRAWLKKTGAHICWPNVRARRPCEVCADYPQSKSSRSGSGVKTQPIISKCGSGVVDKSGVCINGSTRMQTVIQTNARVASVDQVIQVSIVRPSLAGLGNGCVLAVVN
jgi:hypothetical protein